MIKNTIFDWKKIYLNTKTSILNKELILSVLISLITVVISAIYFPLLLQKFAESKEYYFIFLCAFSIFNFDFGVGKFIYATRDVNIAVIVLFTFLTGILFFLVFFISGDTNTKLLELIPLMSIVQLAIFVKVVFDILGNVLVGFTIKLFRLLVFVCCFYFFDTSNLITSALYFYVCNVAMLLFLIYLLYPRLHSVNYRKFEFNSLKRFSPFLLVSITLLISNIIDKYVIIHLIDAKELLKFAFINDSSNYILFSSNLFFSTAFFKIRLVRKYINITLILLGLLSIILYIIYGYLYAFDKYGIAPGLEVNFSFWCFLLFVVYIANSLHWYNLYELPKLISSRQYIILSVIPIIIYYIFIYLFHLIYSNYIIFLIPQIIRLLLELYLFNMKDFRFKFFQKRLFNE